MGTVPFFPPRGISLIEVLFSIGVLTVGLFGIAMLIPLGKLALMETEKSDRTGACGRAALRDVDVRRMLDYSLWYPTVQDSDTTPNIIAIDPLGYPSLLPTLAGAGGGIPRYTFWQGAVGNPMTEAAADPIFRWSDDLLFTLPEDMNPPQTGDRPVPVPPGGQSTGAFSWFLTVAASPADTLATPPVPFFQRRSYNVSVVVCNKRILTTDGERVIQNVACTGGGYGGISVTKAGEDVTSHDLPIKNNEWVLLYSANQTAWYRVVYAGYDLNNTISHITLVGPDWHGGGTANIVLVGGVTGVYTTTMQLDDDLIWSR